jgi:hypothetical protein
VNARWPRGHDLFERGACLGIQSAVRRHSLTLSASEAIGNLGE